ncbi:MAG: sulfatase, partial [Candidatus Hydrogenedentota bacterium]
MKDFKDFLRVGFICLIIETIYLIFSTHIYLLYRPQILYLFPNHLINEILFFLYVLAVYTLFFISSGFFLKLINRLLKFKIDIELLLLAFFIFIAVGLVINWDVLPSRCTIFSLHGAGATSGVALLAISIYLILSGLKRNLHLEVKNRLLFLIFAVLITLWGLLSFDAPTKNEKPDIYLIVLDTLRQKDVSLYYKERKTTPFLETLKDKAVVYNNAYTVSPWTLPAHTSLFTSKYTTEHGAVSGDKTLDESPDWVTLQEILLENDYNTYALCANPIVALNIHNILGFKGFYSLPFVRNNFVLLRLFHYFMNLDDHDMGANQSLQFLKNLLFYKKGPRFIFINWLECHKPYVSPYSYKNKWLGYQPPKDEYMNRYKKIRYDKNTKLTYTQEDRTFFYKYYLAAINYLDDCLKNLFEILSRDKQRFDKSMIIITSDHGENIFEHNLWGHMGSLHNNLLKIPLVILYPDRLITGEDNSIATILDIFPTILGVLKISKPVEIRGYDLLSNTRDEKVYAEYFDPGLFIVKFDKNNKPIKIR